MRITKRLFSVLLCLLLVGSLLPLAASAQAVELVLDFTKTNPITVSGENLELLRTVVNTNELAGGRDNNLYLDGDGTPDLASSFSSDSVTLSLHSKRSATGTFSYPASESTPGLRIILPDTAPNPFDGADGVAIDVVYVDLSRFLTDGVTLLPGQTLPACSVRVTGTNPAWVDGDMTADALWYAIDSATLASEHFSDATGFWQLLQQKGVAVKANAKVESGKQYIPIASFTLSEDSEAYFGRNTAFFAGSEGDSAIPSFTLARSSTKRMLFIPGEGVIVPSGLDIAYPRLTSHSGKLPAITFKTSGDLASQVNVKAEWRTSTNSDDEWDTAAPGSDIEQGLSYQLWFAITAKNGDPIASILNKDPFFSINGRAAIDKYGTETTYYIRAEMFKAGEYNITFEYPYTSENCEYFNFTDKALTFAPEGHKGSATFDPKTGLVTLNGLQMSDCALYYYEPGVKVVVKGNVELAYISADDDNEDLYLSGDGQLTLSVTDDALYSPNSVYIDGVRLIVTTHNDSDGGLYDSSSGRGLFISGKANVTVRNITDDSSETPAIRPRRLDLSGLSKDGVVELSGKPALSGAGAQDEFGHSIQTPYTDTSWIILPAECRIVAGESEASAKEVSTEDFLAGLATFGYVKITSLADPVLYGDVDGNGKVNAVDALWTLQAAVGKRNLTDMQFTAANVNGDDKANAVDALLILKKAVNKLDKFPVEQ